MRGKKAVINLILILFIFSFTTIVYAYFVKTLDSDTHEITTDFSEETIVQVSTFEEFCEAVRLVDGEYNSDDEVSVSTNRTTILLNDNIYFTADALVIRDCHINLNNYSIDLLGNKLIYKHQYKGLFSVYNGVITDSSIAEDEEEVTYGTIIIDCPNACIDITTSVDENVDITINSASEEMVCNSAMMLVYSNVLNSGVNDFYSTIDSLDSYNNNCTLEHTDDYDACCYTYTDLDLIYSYFAYSELTICYNSYNLSVLSNAGRVLDNSTTTSVLLEVSVSYKEVVLTKAICVHIVSEADYAAAGLGTLLGYLDKYYQDDKYVFDKSFLLPKENSYFGVLYTYTLSNGVSSSSTNDYFDLDKYDEYILVGLTKEITAMTISATINDTTVSSDTLAVDGQASSNLDDNYSYAIGIVTALYGNQFTIKAGQPTSSNYTEYQLLVDYTINGYSRLTNISYELVNNNEGTYQITDYESDNQYYNKYQKLSVVPEPTTEPYISQTVYVAITFTFKEDSLGKVDAITIQIPIVYDVTENGAGFAEFDPYFVYFNKEFSSRTNNFTYSSFEMPLCFNSDYPTYAYIIYQDNNDGTYTKLEDNNLFNVSFNDDDSYKNFTKDSMFNITINPYYINFDTTNYLFVYIPVYVDTSGNILYYTENDTTEDLSNINMSDEEIAEYDYISYLTIPGIVRYQSTNSVIEEEFFDKEFYTIAYELINGDGSYSDNEVYLLSSTLGNYIEIVDLSSESTSLLTTYGYTLSISETDSESVINSLKGINLLIGIHELTFSGTSLLSDSDLDINQIEYISQITSLNILSLGNTGIYDQKVGTLNFPAGNSNDIINILSGLTNLTELYLNDNKIYDFGDLVNFVSLKTVDVTNNTFSGSIFGITVIDNAINSVVNGIYGSGGATNAAVFAVLETNGVTVIYEGASTDIDSDTLAIIEALQSIEYQDRVSNQISLENIISIYSTNYEVYNLTNQYVTGDEDDGVRIRYTFKSISFECEESVANGVYTAKLFTFNITYSWEYSTYYGSILGWGSYGTGDVDIVTYKYQYKVTRY